jgi:hypothetical protein
MTPKEKAIEIYSKMFNQIFAYYATDRLAKDCAILAVDEILDVIEANIYSHHYWEQVKQELENL